jgi:mono/diheme cytochrome c family protein
MSSDDNNFPVEQSGASDESIQRVHAELQHRKPEKVYGYSAFPLVLLGIMCSLVFFGSIYLAHYSAHFDPTIYNEHEKPHTGPAEVVAVSQHDLGKRVFNRTCITCHQATGLGVPGVYPPLAGSEWAQGPEDRVIHIVLYGLTGPIRVKDKDFDNSMASLGTTLKDDDIANALTYVRSEWGNNAPAVTAEAVAKVRAENPGRTTPMTPSELMKYGK